MRKSKWNNGLTLSQVLSSLNSRNGPHMTDSMLYRGPINGEKPEPIVDRKTLYKQRSE
jgi:hypothetical protein